MAVMRFEIVRTNDEGGGRLGVCALALPKKMAPIISNGANHQTDESRTCRISTQLVI